MVGENLKSNARQRASNWKSTGQKTVANVKTLVADVKTRVVEGGEPQGGANLGGAFGHRGILPFSVFAVVRRQKDIMAEQVQSGAKANRSLIKGVGGR